MFARVGESNRCALPGGVYGHTIIVTSEVSFHWPRNNANTRFEQNFIFQIKSRLRWIYFIKLYAMLIFTFDLAQAFPVLNRIAMWVFWLRVCLCVYVCVWLRARFQERANMPREVSYTRYLAVIALSLSRLPSPFRVCWSYFSIYQIRHGWLDGVGNIAKITVEEIIWYARNINERSGTHSNVADRSILIS